MRGDNIKQYQNMTSEEKYQFRHARGLRIEATIAVRRILGNCINYHAKEEGTKPSKILFQKINREIDLPFLQKIFFLLVDKKITVKGLEENYDAIFITLDEVKNKTYDW